MKCQDFESWLGADKVVYVPHGIDTSTFRPGAISSDDKTLKLIVVGEHMRDWEVVHRVIDEADRNLLDVQFDVITRPDCFPYFTGCSNITLHTNVPESELIELYRGADALLLPVKNATGSNAVLESLACGTPVITTNVGGMPDYVNNDCGWLLPSSDTGATVELIKRLCVDKDLTRSRREQARAQALKFDWQRIADRLFAVYSAVLAGRSPAVTVRESERALPSSAPYG